MKNGITRCLLWYDRGCNHTSRNLLRYPWNSKPSTPALLLVTQTTLVERPRFPAIDAHNQLQPGSLPHAGTLARAWPVPAGRGAGEGLFPQRRAGD